LKNLAIVGFLGLYHLEIQLFTEASMASVI